MKKEINILAIVLLLATMGMVGCKKNLDDKFFNSSKITEYKFDDYAGDVDFILPDEYDLDTALVHLFPLYSKAKDETVATKIWAVYIGDTTKIKSTKIILYFHGNKDHMDFYWQRAKLLANVGGKNKFGVMMIDYRGYGLSEGTSSEVGIYADAEAALDWLKSKGLLTNQNSLCVYGFSLGSAPAVELASKYPLPASRLVLEAPIASVATMVADASGLNIDPIFYSGYKFDNVAKVSKLQSPFLWMHGKEDKYLNIETHGQVLFDAYEGTVGVAYKVDGATHNDVPFKFGYKAYCDSLYKFIK
jgi:fermentation-respiration switch protein FrsA (DUF1100 family)